MDVSKVIAVMDTLEIDTEGLTPESRLGPDAGMDSQEIVELRGLLNQEYGLRLPAGCMKKASTLADVAKLMQEQAAAARPPAPEKEGFAYSCETRQVISRDVPTVYEALFRMERWDKLLPHVKAIEVLYDDGTYQEFRMTVASPSGTLAVRSVRRCEADKAIDFFQPEPPAYLKHHAGGWRLTPVEGGGCEVRAFHYWNLHEEVAARTFQQAGQDYREQIRNVLLGHARFALECWKNILETGSLPTQTLQAHS